MPPVFFIQRRENQNHMQHSAGFLQLVRDAKTRIRELSVEQARRRLDTNPEARLIDVREDHEWHDGRAARAAHMGRGIIERDIEQAIPDKQTELILYCGGGYRSALACDNLQRLGYTNIYSLDGGWTAWKDSGAPTEQD